MAAYRPFLLLCLMLLVVRLPHLQRPLSKHHEHNVAVWLINAESWQQAGGGSAFHYTPLLTYQGSGNRLWEQGAYMDSVGHQVYLSYGSAWFTLPYAIFQLTGVPFSPLAIRLFSICCGLLTVLLFQKLLRHSPLSASHTWWHSLLFALMPAPLWYMGTAYVNVAMMLPLVLLLLLWLQRWSRTEEPWLLLAIFAGGIALMHIDWYAVFVLAAFGAWALFNNRNANRWWLVAVCAASATIGVYSILAQYAGYLGWTQVFEYWRNRFADRSMQALPGGAWQMPIFLLRNLVTGYWPLLVLAAFAWWQKPAYAKVPAWLWWMLAATLGYNLLFLNWSAEHEFAFMPLATIACLLLAWLLPQGLPKAWRMLLLAGSLLTYFIINLPGPKSFKGIPYQQQQQLGRQIQKSVPPTMPIFTNLAFDKCTEFYAGRTFNQANSLVAAQHLTDSLKLDSAIYLQVNNAYNITQRQMLVNKP